MLLSRCIKIRPVSSLTSNNYASPELTDNRYQTLPTSPLSKETGSIDLSSEETSEPKTLAVEEEKEEDGRGSDDDDSLKSHENHEIGETGNIVRFRPRGRGMKRPRITREEITKTRKRLEEVSEEGREGV